MNTLSMDLPTFVKEADISLQQFSMHIRQQTRQHDYPLAVGIEKDILIYEGEHLRSAIEQNQYTAYQSEMAMGLAAGPGVLVIKNFFAQVTAIDRMNDVFEALLKQQRSQGEASDHFAKAGENSRLWNSFQKSAQHSPGDFIEYYKNPLLRLVCEAWLGPYYQLTAQVNIVHPGGRSQHPHCDYHLGFQENNNVARYPLHAQRMSQYLTLQGAVAHSDMPLKSGPTLLLPFSQQYSLGYLAWRNADIKRYFEQNAVQLPLEKGDALFFNPALFHAAGNNDTADVHRNANLLQISSGFAKPMENIDLYKVISYIYPALLNRVDKLTKTELDALLMGACDGYSFPSNLDTDPPTNGMAPVTLEQLAHAALTERLKPECFNQQLKAHFKKRQS